MNNKSMLLRQINPNFYQNGRVTSLAFTPFPKDEGRLSVYDGDLISPDTSWHHFTRILKLKSVGTLGVTVEECTSHELNVHPDPIEGNDAHAFVDFTNCEEKARKSKGKKLCELATRRNWLHQPGSAD